MAIKNYKIVVVENDEDERFFMKEAFDATHLFQVMAQVSNGDRLLEWLEANPRNLPEVILSDLNMPGKNGYDIISELGQHPIYSLIPIIITSTSSTRTIIEKCLQMGAAEYLVKPETFNEYIPFMKEMHRLIGEKHLVG
jgi:CheY-like chemotaxis protein